MLCVLEYDLLSSFMISVVSSFVYLSLTSDEINNVIRLSPRRDGEVLRTPHDSPRTFLPRLRKHVGPELPPERDKKRPYPVGFPSTMTNIFLIHRTSPNHRGFSSHPPKGGDCRRNDPVPELRKTLREGRSVSAHLTELDSGYMINSLLPQNYRAHCAEESNFEISFQTLIK